MAAVENCWSEENRIQRFFFFFFPIMAMFSWCYFWRKGWGGSLALIPRGVLSQALTIQRRMCGCVLRIPREGLHMHSFHWSFRKESWKPDTDPSTASARPGLRSWVVLRAAVLHRFFTLSRFGGSLIPPLWISVQTIVTLRGYTILLHSLLPLFALCFTRLMTVGRSSQTDCRYSLCKTEKAFHFQDVLSL